MIRRFYILALNSDVTDAEADVFRRALSDAQPSEGDLRRFVRPRDLDPALGPERR